MCLVVEKGLWRGVSLHLILGSRLELHCVKRDVCVMFDRAKCVVLGDITSVSFEGTLRGELVCVLGGEEELWRGGLNLHLIQRILASTLGCKRRCVCHG